MKFEALLVGKSIVFLGNLNNDVQLQPGWFVNGKFETYNYLKDYDLQPAMSPLVDRGDTTGTEEDVRELGNSKRASK